MSEFALAEDAEDDGAAEEAEDEDAEDEDAEDEGPDDPPEVDDDEPQAARPSVSTTTAVAQDLVTLISARTLSSNRPAGRLPDSWAPSCDATHLRSLSRSRDSAPSY